MIELRRTRQFARWLDRLSDFRGRARILARLRRLAAGHPGDVRSVGGGVSELRIHHGPGYRVYFTRKDKTVILLLAGGDKKTQVRDIALAQALAHRPEVQIDEDD